MHIVTVKTLYSLGHTSIYHSMHKTRREDFGGQKIFAGDYWLLQSVDWTGGLDWWTGLVDWTTDYGCGIYLLVAVIMVRAVELGWKVI